MKQLLVYFMHKIEGWISRLEDLTNKLDEIKKSEELEE